jgi:hypothetical protein
LKHQLVPLGFVIQPLPLPHHGFSATHSSRHAVHMLLLTSSLPSWASIIDVVV